MFALEAEAWVNTQVGMPDPASWDLNSRRSTSQLELPFFVVKRACSVHFMGLQSALELYVCVSQRRAETSAFHFHEHRADVLHV